MDTNETVQALTYGEVAERLRVSKAAVAKMVKVGRLRVVRLGHRTARIPVSEVKRFLAGDRFCKCGAELHACECFDGPEEDLE